MKQRWKRNHKLNNKTISALPFYKRSPSTPPSLLALWSCDFNSYFLINFSRFLRLFKKLTWKECTSAVSRSILSLMRMYPVGVTVNLPPARWRLYENTALLPYKWIRWKSEGLFLRAKNHTPFNPYASVCPITLDHIDSTSSLSTAVTLMTVIPNEAFSSTAPV